MDILVIFVAILCVCSIRFCREGFFEDYLSVKNTKVLRGILALLVVLHHSYQETDAGMLHLLLSNAGVPCVALFFFMSAYGLQKSFAAKPGYETRILKRRIPAVAVPFLVLVPVYWLLYALIGKPYSVLQLLNSFVSGSPIVRYGWYTECLILLYLVYFLGTHLVRKQPEKMPLGSLALTVLLVLVLKLLDIAYFWYAAIIAFPAGVFWAAYEKKLLSRMEKHYWLWLAASFVLFGAMFAGTLKTFHMAFFWAMDLTLVLFMVLLLRKVTFRNPVLDFLGGLSFEIYSLHGFFMLLYRSRIVYIESDLIWGIAVLMSAIPAAFLLNRGLKKLL